MFDCLIISVRIFFLVNSVGTGRKASCLVQPTRRFKIYALGLMIRLMVIYCRYNVIGGDIGFLFSTLLFIRVLDL